MLLGTQRVNDRGHLEIGGCDTVELAKEFGTPLYVMDEAALRDNCRRYKAAFEARYPGENEVSYAGKAFLVQAMARLVDSEGLSLDVASSGELYTALTAGFPASRILFHGNYKSDAELLMGLEAGVGRFVVDNFFELRRLSALAVERNTVQPILLRVTPGIDPHTHRRIRTGQEDSKFGINISDHSALEAVQRRTIFRRPSAGYPLSCRFSASGCQGARGRYRGDGGVPRPRGKDRRRTAGRA